ncbi:hypothetical protein AL532_25950 [Pseudomonas monteilii]|uniref:Uncharacterized protein n=1 Tax=Pseudomonas kurunegalensis TaxID=485880 RepID=A0ACC5UVB8_9PSED|nr:MULTISPECIES: hypothetical protein [Pseudomonas]AVH39518.1 hypothetical protein AL532_25950 [Pseudomonas monteilii]MBV4518399.1 hypothetical protein [Pseudomonas kurunegalensis]
MTQLWEPVNGVFTATASWLPSLDFSIDYWSLFTTVIGALAGAWLGAWAAQRIAARHKLRDELQKELRSTNAGIMLSYTITNLSYALKKQHIKKLKESYDSDCLLFELYKQEKANGAGKEPFKMSPNLDRLEEVAPPISALQNIVMGQISTTGRAIASVTGLADAIGNLNDTLRGRNHLLEKIKEDDLPHGAKIEHFYLGIPYAEGKANIEYGCYVQALWLYTNDVIFFSMKLSEDLREHGLHVAKKYTKKFRGDAPKVSDFDWSKAEQEGLLPRDEEYDGWLSGFPASPKKESFSTLHRLRKRIFS